MPNIRSLQKNHEKSAGDGGFVHPENRQKNSGYTLNKCKAANPPKLFVCPPPPPPPPKKSAAGWLPEY